MFYQLHSLICLLCVFPWTFYPLHSLICLLCELQTPRIVSLLSESYNPHVRYGAAFAVGISCVGTGLSEAISLLEPLTSDVDFVRQGALIAMAMVMVQISEASDSRVGTFRYFITFCRSLIVIGKYVSVYDNIL